MSSTGQMPQTNVSRSNTEVKRQENPTTKHKKQRKKVWYKFKEKKKPVPPFLRLPEDVLWIIFSHFFTNVHMTDIKTTQTGTIQRRYGAQSLLFVCKALREMATAAMFRFATFHIPHFKLHAKHIRENKMTTLHKIQNLALLWTPPPSPGFTTKRGDDAYVLRTIDHLRSVQVWLLASQHLRLGFISEPEEMSRTELHEAMLAKFEPSIQSQPKWLKRLLRDAPLHFKGVNMSIVGFFAFGSVKGGDLYARSSLLSYYEPTDITTGCAHILAREIDQWY